MKSIGTVPLSKRVKYKISARPHAGLFFCLASAEGAGLLFLPCCNTAPYKRLQHVLFRPCNYAAHAAKRLTGLYKGFSCDLSHSTATNTRPTQAAIIPPAPRWSVSQRLNGLHRYQIPPPRRTLCSSTQPPYYNKVYKGASLLLIHAKQRSRSQTMPTRRVCACRLWIAGKCYTQRTC